MKNKNLSNAKKNKNDEFYTQLSDIEKECSNYKNHFKGATIYCNCDDCFESNFFKYFALNFKYFGLKRLIATCYGESKVAQLSFWDDNEEENKKAYVIDINEENINTIIEKNKVLNMDGVMELAKENAKVLNGDGDFRSEECLEYLKQCDIVVTNPPFSLFREFIATIVKYNKKILVIGNKNAIPCKDIFPLINDNQLWTGYNSPNEFSTPNGTITKQVTGLCRWFTNLDIKKRHEDLILWKKRKGNEEEYPKYYNYDAINVDKTSDIPCDYCGVMGVPITWLDKYNPDQFEILGCYEPAIDLVTFKKCSYFKNYESRQITINNTLCQKTYHRIFIKFKQSYIDAHPEQFQKECKNFN